MWWGRGLVSRFVLPSLRTVHVAWFGKPSVMGEIGASVGTKAADGSCRMLRQTSGMGEMGLSVDFNGGSSTFDPGSVVTMDGIRSVDG